MLQYRRGDIAGLLMVSRHSHRPIVTASSSKTSSRWQLTDSMAKVVVSARLKWWDRLWAKPLGPVLLAGESLILPEGSEEVERWRADTVRALDLPDATRVLGEFVSTDDYPQALELVGSNPFLLLHRWHVTVDAIGERLVAIQTGTTRRKNSCPASARSLGQFRLVGVDRVSDAELSGPLAQLADTATSALDSDAGRRSALRELDTLMAAAPVNAMTAVVLNSLVASLHGDPSRAVLRDDELDAAARRAVEVALEVFGDQHLVTMSAQLNHAVVVEERADIPGPRRWHEPRRSFWILRRGLPELVYRSLPEWR